GITVRTLVDINQLHTKVGMTILTAAVIDDVIGIIILSVLAGVAYGSFTLLGIAETIVVMAIFFLVVIYVGFKVVPRLLSYVGRFHVEEMALSTALVLTFLVAALAEKVGIAAITGAFLVGLIAGKSSAAETLRAKASTVGYGLLVPLFFVYMGASTDLRILGQVGLLTLGFIMVALFDKVAGCGIGALLSGFGKRDALRVGIGMMPRAEVALVMAAIGVRAGVVGPGLLSMTVLVVLFTSMVTPLLVKAVFKERPKRKRKDLS
ncbi:MAG: cation:proton antiporter, partial [Candidatus Hadarchaeota archaeon]